MREERALLPGQPQTQARRTGVGHSGWRKRLCIEQAVKWQGVQLGWKDIGGTGPWSKGHHQEWDQGQTQNPPP